MKIVLIYAGLALLFLCSCGNGTEEQVATEEAISLTADSLEASTTLMDSTINSVEADADSLKRALDELDELFPSGE